MILSQPSSLTPVPEGEAVMTHGPKLKRRYIRYLLCPLLISNSRLYQRSLNLNNNVPHLLLSPLLSLIPEQAQHQISCHPNAPIQRPTSPLQLDSCHVYNIYNINNSHNHQPNVEPHRYTSLESVSTPGCATTPTMSRLYNAYNTYNQLPNGQPNSQPNVSQPLPTHHPTGHPGILVQFFPFRLMDYIEVAGSIEEWVEMVRLTNSGTPVLEGRVMMQSTKNKQGMSEIVKKRRQTWRTCRRGSSRIPNRRTGHAFILAFRLSDKIAAMLASVWIHVTLYLQ
jgi:hypothetical protein